MASPARSALLDVIRGKEVSQFNFFQLVELLHRFDGTDQAFVPRGIPDDDAVHFKATASLGFHPSDILHLGINSKGIYELEVTFLGLHGSQSPMPGYYLDRLAWEYAQSEQRLGHFFDFFHHRLLSLLHQIWRKYRYYIHFQENSEDVFSSLIFALIGLGIPALSKTAPVIPANMLAYAGMLASSCRSPEIVAGLVAHCFDLGDVALLPWQERRVSIGQELQNRLGLACSTLGEDWVIGEQVPDCSGKFLLQLNRLTFERFLEFIPNGKNYTALLNFVSFVMSDQLAWDLELVLSGQEMKGFTLGDDQTLLLGWSSFIGRPQGKPFVNIKVQG